MLAEELWLEMKTHEHGYHVDLELSDRSRE